MLEQMVMQAHSLGWSFDIAVLGLIWWSLSLGSRIVATFSALIHPHLCRSRARRRDQPPVSVIIPVKELISEAEAAFASVFSQTYPDFEVVISAAETASPMIEAARQVAARFPHIRSRFIVGNALVTLNPKVSNLVPAIAEAHNDLLLIKDSNILLEDGQLAELVRNLTSGVGLVCAIPIAVAPVGFPAEIECVAMNAYGPPPLLLASLFGRNIALGKVMLFVRQDLERAGGIGRLAETFGDDHVLGKMLARIDLRTVYVETSVRQVLGCRSCRQVWDRQLRWMVIRKTEVPFTFFVEPFLGPVFTVLAGIGAASLFGQPWWVMATATLVAWRLLDTMAVTLNKGDWSWRFLIAGFCWDLILPLLWLRAWAARSVRWGGVDIEFQSRPG